MHRRFASKLLYLRLVLVFVFFGLIVGYATFLMGTILGSYQIFKTFKDGFGNSFHSLLDSNEADILYKAFKEEHDLGRSIENAFINLIPEDQRENIKVSLYAFDPDESLWHVLTTQRNTDKSINEKLQNSLTNALLTDDDFFKPEVNLGTEKRQNFFFDISEERDHYSYVLQVSLQQDGIKTLIEKEKSQLYAFTIMVVILSLILGSGFAKSIARPIRRLTDQALIFSKGNTKIRFKTKRWDDIGILSRSMDQMSQSLEHRFQSMQTMNQIDRAVLSSVSRKDLLKKVATYISKQFDNSPIVVLTHKDGGNQISTMIPEVPTMIDKYIENSSLPQDILDEQEKQIEVAIRDQAFKHKVFPPELLKKSVLCIPILHNEFKVATFIITRDSFTDQDKEALGMLSDQTGVALRSMNEVEQREELSHGILIALTRSVDAKSKWTAGHSDRVAKLSIQLAQKLNMSEDEIKTIKISALLHDIGKLGIPELILDKPGKLSDEEFIQIQSHPVKGDEIIKDIPGFETVRLAVRHHHEKWDGGGYPDKLSGIQIPYLARILTLADVFDAITEDRPYRKGFNPEKTIEFLLDQRGKLFDPELLDVFLDMVKEESLL